MMSIPAHVDIDLSDHEEEELEQSLGVNLINQSVVKKSKGQEKVPLLFKATKEDKRLARFNKLPLGKRGARYAQEAIKVAMIELED